MHLFNETKLNSKQAIKFKGYNFVRTDRNCKTSWRFDKKKPNNIPVIDNKIEFIYKLETCIINFQIHSNCCLLIISAYYPSGNNPITSIHAKQ